MQKTFFEVRHVEKKDLGEVKRLIESVDPHASSYVVEKAAEEVASPSGRKPSTAAYVAEVHEGGKKRIAGVATMYRTEDRASLHTILIHPDYRRRGIAPELVKARVQHAFDKWKASRILFMASAREKEPFEAYKKIGFKPVGTGVFSLTRAEYLKALQKQRK